MFETELKQEIKKYAELNQDAQNLVTKLLTDRRMSLIEKGASKWSVGTVIQTTLNDLIDPKAVKDA